jgi:hypothetical protein
MAGRLTFWVALVLWGFGGFGTHAEDARPQPAPGHAEYTDDRGCVFFRVDQDGTPIWLPKLRADRSQICARQPGQPGAIAMDRPPQIEGPAPVVAKAQPGPVPNPVPRPLPRPLPRRATAAGMDPMDGVQVPKGYRRVWMDGRLNTKRGLR